MSDSGPSRWNDLPDGDMGGIDHGQLFEALVHAYMRGAEWAHQYGDLEYLQKAAYDYADKTMGAMRKKAQENE